jgi:hypothetical protein
VQAVIDVLEGGELELEGHVVHALAPATVEYVPATQDMHAVPVAPLYVPARHCVHVPPFDPEKPTLQVQATSAVLGLTEFEFSGHDAHALEAAAVENLPSTQFAHTSVPTVLLNFPAGHDVHVLSPANVETTPTPQFVHTEEPAAEYLPASQFPHNADPVVPLNFPAGHDMH